MYRRVREISQQVCKLTPGSPVLLGFSGGPDSTCLMDILDRAGYPLIVAHYNHKLRAESDGEAIEACKMAEARKLIFISESGDVAAYANAHALSIEEAGRELRYRFLFHEAGELGVQAVIVGHNANDQVETLLMHLLRGAGLAGLKGMQFRTLPNPWSQEVPLVRPLLSSWREDISKYNLARGLEPLQDQSNFDTTFYRNRLRHELIPYLQEYNPAIKQVLWRTADVLSGDYEVLSGVTAQAWETVVAEQHSSSVSFSADQLKRLPAGLQRLVFLHAIELLKPELRDIGLEAIDRAVGFLNAPTKTGRADLLGGLFLLLEGEQLWLADWEEGLPVGDWPRIEPGREVPIHIPGRLALGRRWILRVERIEAVGAKLEQALANTDAYRAWVDADEVAAPFTVRARQPGDRFEPLGMEGHSVKVSDYMINEKIPLRARPTWPLLVSGDRIVWVPGFRLSHAFRLRPDSTRALLLRLERE